MYASEDFLRTKGVDFNKPYRLFYRNICDHSITGQEFRMNVDFKPEFRDSYVECAHFQTEIIGSLGGILLTFMKTGCSGEVEAIYLGDLIIDGRSNDLSEFTISNNTWHSLHINIHADSSVLELDQNVIYSGRSPSPIGNIIGIRFEFLGNGRIRNFNIREDL